jgi:hypothetical protein
METAKARDLAKRQRLAQVMAEISRGWSLAPASYLLPKQIRVAIAEAFNQEPLSRPIAIGRGVAFAFGEHAKLHTDLGIPMERSRFLQEISTSPKALYSFLIGMDEARTAKAASEIEL